MDFFNFWIYYFFPPKYENETCQVWCNQPKHTTNSWFYWLSNHYCDVTMGAMASQITSVTSIYSTVIQAQIKENIKLRVSGLCAGNSPHKWPVTRKMFPFDDVIMYCNLGIALKKKCEDILLIYTNKYRYLDMILMISNLSTTRWSHEAHVYGNFKWMFFVTVPQRNNIPLCTLAKSSHCIVLLSSNRQTIIWTEKSRALLNIFSCSQNCNHYQIHKYPVNCHC